MKEIDAKGLACPAPVIQAKKVVENERPDAVSVIVDNTAAVENVTRYLGSQHYETRVDQEGEVYRIQGKYNPASPDASNSQTDDRSSVRQKILLFVRSDRIGSGDDELGKKLMISYLSTVHEMGPDCWRLVFVNNGVKLTVADSPVLEALQALEKSGTHILVCGTCLGHFNLLEQKQVGETTNMLDIVTAMQLADKVVTV